MEYNRKIYFCNNKKSKNDTILCALHVLSSTQILSY